VVTLFVQLYESSEAAVKSEIATFMEAFPQGIVFGNELNGSGYDLVLLGQRDPAPLDIDLLEARLQSPDSDLVRQSLREIGIPTAVGLLSTYAGSGPDLAGWLADAALNRDRDLRLQYLAGLGLNLRHAGLIYENMLGYRRAPEGLFVGSDGARAALWDAIQAPR